MQSAAPPAGYQHAISASMQIECLSMSVLLVDVSGTHHKFCLNKINEPSQILVIKGSFMSPKMAFYHARDDPYKN